MLLFEKPPYVSFGRPDGKITHRFGLKEKVHAFILKKKQHRSQLLVCMLCSADEFHLVSFQPSGA